MTKVEYVVRLILSIQDVNATTMSWWMNHYTFKKVQMIFKLKHYFSHNTFNLIFVFACDTCKEEYIKEKKERKTKSRDRVKSLLPTHSETTIPTF